MSSLIPRQAFASKTRGQLPDISDLVETEVSASIFEKARPLEWNNHGAVKTNPEEVSNEVLILNDFITIITCGGRALDRYKYPLYVRLSFAPGPHASNKDKINHVIEMFQTLGGQDAVVKQLLDQLKKQPRMQLIYTPADLAHPFGWFFHQLAKPTKPMYKKALLISLMGTRNAIMCRSCIRSYTTNKSWNDEHVLWPFHACISLKDAMGCSCSNCVWRGVADCDWSYLPGYVAKSPNEGTLNYSLKGMMTGNKLDPFGWSEDQLNPNTTPYIASTWPVLPKRGESADDRTAREDQVKDEINRWLDEMEEGDME
jgi:hypothetical protein